MEAVVSSKTSLSPRTTSTATRVQKKKKQNRTDNRATKMGNPEVFEATDPAGEVDSDRVRPFHHPPGERENVEWCLPRQEGPPHRAVLGVRSSRSTDKERGRGEPSEAGNRSLVGQPPHNRIVGFRALRDKINKVRRDSPGFCLSHYLRWRASAGEEYSRKREIPLDRYVSGDLRSLKT